MPQFTLKEMLLATTLIAVGVGAMAFLYHSADAPRGLGNSAQVGLAVLLWFGGGALVGAGLFTPFKRPWTGASVAFALQVLLMVWRW